MKVFIVFLGILLINVSFLSYQGDMGRYTRCQAFLKAVAEECAAGAALYYDEPAYAEGQLRFYRDEGRKYIEYIIEESQKEMPLPTGSGISYEAVFQDEGVEIPSVTVELTAATEDLFRLPFLEIKEIKRAAKYELPQ
jgi:hypothetical protein